MNGTSEPSDAPRPHLQTPVGPPPSHADLLDRALPAVLTTHMPDGRLQSTVVWFWRHAEEVRLSTMAQFRKARNLLEHPRATLNVTGPDGRWLSLQADVVAQPGDGTADLDAVGNTTKAITKGIAIGSAVIAAVSLFGSFLVDVSRAQTGMGVPIAQQIAALGIRVDHPQVFVGMLLGGALPWLFSSFAIQAVTRAASLIVLEVRRQFKLGVLEGKIPPDYRQAVAISTTAAQKELVSLALLGVVSPIVVGLLLQVEALGGFLAGLILSGQLLAVFLNRGVAFKALLRGAFFFPFTLSVVTVGLTWLWLLDPVVGPFNYYMRRLGLAMPSLLAEPGTAMWGIVLTSVWWVTGYYLVIYLAGLQDIPRHLYEAAAIDGASAWRSFWSITVPLLRPVFLFVFVIHIIGSFQIFGQVFVMTQGGPGDATRTVVQHLYETAFQSLFAFGSASAMAWVLFAVILVFSLLQFRILRGHAEY